RRALRRPRAPRSLSSGLADWCEAVLEVVVGDLLAELHTGDDGEAVVEASPDARVCDLRSHVVRSREMLHGVQIPRRTVRIEAVDVEIDLIRAEEGAEHGGHRSGERAVCGGVLGVVGCRE